MLAQSTLSASPYLLNNHPEVFPDPHVFRPERWIEARARGENLYKHLATFGKGSRGCLGMKYVKILLPLVSMLYLINMLTQN